MSWAYVLPGAVIVGSVGWLLFGGGQIEPGKAARFERPPAAVVKLDPAALVLARLQHLDRLSLFPAVVVPEDGAAVLNTANLRLRGTSQSPGRRAALISIDGASAQWIAVGQATAGLDLIELAATRAVIRTSSGEVVTLDLFKPEAASSSSGAPDVDN